MAGVPVVKWYTGDNLTDITLTGWSVKGVGGKSFVDAGNPSQEDTFLIWNNRGETDPLLETSTMTDCEISVKDSAGGNTGDLVTGQWTKVKCLSTGETTFTAIGGAVAHVIGAGGTAGTQEILGTANTGDMAVDTGNFASVTLYVQPPVNAVAGSYNFKVRVSYNYI